MRSDDDLRDDEEQARAEHHRSRRDYYAGQREARLEEYADSESEEATEAAWMRAFARQAIEEAPVYWSERPGIDRRVFAVDGEVDEHRPVSPEYEIPWPT